MFWVFLFFYFLFKKFGKCFAFPAGLRMSTAYTIAVEDLSSEGKLLGEEEKGGVRFPGEDPKESAAADDSESVVVDTKGCELLFYGSLYS